MAEAGTLLIIEDDLFLRFSLRAYLEDSGFTCLEACDGQEGIEAVLAHRPDLVVTDLRMPGVDGFGVLRALRALSPATPVILLSGAGDGAVTEEALELGAVACLGKPLTDLERFVATVRGLLADGAPGVRP